MFLKFLSLYDFRSHEKSSFEFTSDSVAFIAPNGEGKTNVIEAICLLSTGKSWRQNSGIDLIKHDEDFSLINAKTEEDSYSLEITRTTKRFKRNNKNRPLKSHIGEIPTLLFCPEYLHLFSGPKADRIRFFDRFLCQYYPTYLEILKRHQIAHKNKTAALKQFPLASEAEIEPWNQILAETYPQILSYREEFIQEVLPYLEKNLFKLSQKNEPINLSLEQAEETGSTKDSALSFLSSVREKERILKKNLLSAQRDDFQFFLRERPITKTASRGEERSVLLAFIGAQKDLLIKTRNKAPILLLDDVFSELDESRQSFLSSLVEGGQVFFTTTHEDHVKGFLEKTQIIPI